MNPLQVLKRLAHAPVQLAKLADRTERMFHLERERALREIVQADPRLADPRSLNRFEHQLFSQCGQDGIIGEIFRRLGTTKGFFVEFGVGAGDGFETNTTNLLLQGWSGLWIEASDEGCATIRRNFSSVLKSGQLRLHQAFLNRDNIADIFRQAQVPTSFDLLSIDIDGNDLWMWQALRDFKPACVSIEYNSHFPARQDWVLPYRADHTWPVSMEYGASAKAIERVGTELGYRLVACDLTGCDCFLVRADLCADHFAGPFTAEQWHHPVRHYLIGRPGHARRLHEPFSSRD